MENIKIAKTCGLCAGCIRAINLATEASKTENVTLFKEIVHNKNINNHLKSLGINQIENIIDAKINSKLVIRAHGEPPQTYEYLTKNNIQFIDGTCPNVKTIHNKVKEFSNKGFIIVIVGKYGKKNNIIHPEVAGTIGYCKTSILIEDIDDLTKINQILNSKLYVVCQTTFNPEKFELICQNIKIICKSNNNELIINNSICSAQKLIQKSSLELSKNSDFMIIVGGKNSSNTIELFENIKKNCSAIHIENIDDWLSELEKNNIYFSKNSKIGLTAGASTNKNELVLLKTKIENYLMKKEG